MVTATGEFIDGGLSETGIFEYEDGFTVALTDSEPPITSVNLIPGTYNQPIDLTLSANEPAVIYYRLNGSIEQIYGLPIHLLAPTLVQYHSVDTAGNIESEHEVFYDIDISLTSISPAPGYYPHAVDVELSNELGLTIRYAIDGGPWQQYTAPIHLTESVSTTLLYSSGEETVRTATYEIDETPFQITANLPAETHRRAVNVTFSKNLQEGVIFVSVNGAVWEPYTEPFKLPDGNCTLSYYGVCHGHTYQVVTKSYVINPNLTFVLFSPLPIDVSAQQQALIHLTPNIHGQVFYQLEDEPWSEYTTPVEVVIGQTLRARLGSSDEFDEIPYHVKNTVDRWVVFG